MRKRWLAYIGLHKVVNLTLCCSRHKIALKCTKIQEFACNFEKCLGGRDPGTPAAWGVSASRTKTHTQYSFRPYAEAAFDNERQSHQSDDAALDLDCTIERKSVATDVNWCIADADKVNTAQLPINLRSTGTLSASLFNCRPHEEIIIIIIFIIFTR